MGADRAGDAGARRVTSELPPVSVRAMLMRNTAWYGLVTFIGLASGLLMSIILARGLGPSLMGDYSYLLWALRMLTAIATLGWTLATVRYTAEAYASGERERALGFVRFFLRRQLVTTAVVVTAVMAIVLTEVEPRLRVSFIVLALMLVPVTIEGIYTHAVYGAQRYDLTTQTSTVKMGLHLLASIVVVALGFDILGLVVALFLGTTLSCIMQRARARDVLGGVGVAPSAGARREIRGYVRSLAVVAVLEALVRDRSEIFFLRLFAGPEEIAYYSLAFGLATRVMVVPEIAVGALLPALAALHGRGDREEFARVYRTAMRYVALSGAPIAALVAALAPGVIHWLYGAAYLPAARLLGVLAVVAVLGALRKVAASSLQAVGDRHCALTATGIAVALNIVLAFFVIPTYATAGAVLANSIAQVVASVWAFVGMARLHGARVPVGDLARISIAAALLFAVARIVAGDSHDLPRLVLAAAAGGAAFLVAALATRALGPREWTLLTTSTRRLLAARAGSA
jgi:O-antigen/teichoic acid export membrane protein